MRGALAVLREPDDDPDARVHQELADQVGVVLVVKDHEAIMPPSGGRQTLEMLGVGGGLPEAWDGLSP